MADTGILSLIQELAKQGVGALLAAVMFAVWLKTARQDAQWQREHIKRLEDILRERKTDRDALLLLLGKLETHLSLVGRKAS